MTFPPNPSSIEAPRVSEDDFAQVHRLAHALTHRVRTELGLTACNSIARVTGTPHPREAAILEVLRRVYHCAASCKVGLLEAVEDLTGLGVIGEDLEGLREAGMVRVIEAESLVPGELITPPCGF